MMLPLFFEILRGLAFADQPYIDHLKLSMPPKEEKPGIEEIKQALPPKANPEGYTERLKQSDPERYAPETGGSYTEQIKQQLSPAPADSVIGAVQSGTAKPLKPRIDETIHSAFGFRLAPSLAREITATPGAQASPFSTAYPSGGSPELTLFYEYQPFHSEVFGNFGFYGSASADYFFGHASFANPTVLANFGGVTQPRTKLNFWVIPVTLGVTYRFNLFQVIRPFVLAGGTIVGYLEDRTDGVDGHRGKTFAYTLDGGINILMDWISPDLRWDAYASNGIKHIYLTVDYALMTSLPSDVTFNYSGINAGFTFEF